MQAIADTGRDGHHVLDRAADAHDLASDTRVWSEFEIAENDDDPVFDRAVDVAVAENRHYRGADRTSHAVVAEDRDHRIDHFPFGRGVAKHGDDEKLLAAAYAFEKVLGTGRQRLGVPPLCR